jgi:transcriptional regulator with XRE-family HTH domain
MGRPSDPPPLAPRKPTTVLAWAMRKLRATTSWSVRKTASEFGCDASHISRVERGGTPPSRELVQFYEEQFDGDGLLLSLFEVVEHAAEQNRRRRAHGNDPKRVRAIAGDASTYVDDTIPHGSLMTPGQPFTKIWRVRNSGTVHWHSRRLERQGPLNGPGLIRSDRYVDIPDTEPGEIATIEAPLQAPGYDSTSIAYFKMVDQEGSLCFPDNYQLGLDVLVMVRGQPPIRPHEGGGGRHA